jgi:hypothetical protein
LALVDLVPTSLVRGEVASGREEHGTPTASPVSPRSHSPSPRGREDKKTRSTGATPSPPHKRRSSTLSPKRASGGERVSPRSPITINKTKYHANINSVKETDQLSRSVTSSDPALHKR